VFWISIITSMANNNTVNKAISITDKLGEFEDRHRPFINVILKPMLTLLVFLSVGYYTMWMSTNYVKSDNFNSYIEKQLISDKEQDQLTKARFEITQTKLETIINQQIAYTEQLKAYNQLLSGFQKQIDQIDSRLMYLERNKNNN